MENKEYPTQFNITINVNVNDGSHPTISVRKNPDPEVYIGPAEVNDHTNEAEQAPLATQTDENTIAHDAREHEEVKDVPEETHEVESAIETALEEEQPEAEPMPPQKE